ncbi:3'(2'),5'-bisphosphate nucleotidase CysQ [Planctomycetota bacterium]
MLEQELKVAKQAVREAGKTILRIAEEHYSTAAKHADRTVVTKADIEADRILQHYLGGEFPEYGWLSEETKDDDRRFDCERVWIVDPMDGTREFVMKVPEFVVSVALADNCDIVLSVILNPCTGELFEAVRGAGAKLNGQQIHCDHQLDGKPKVEVSRSDIEKNRFAGYERHLELHPCGSIAYKLARLADGQADSTLSVTPKNEWDIAGGVILVTEAGGQVTDLAGNKHRFSQADTLVDGVIAASTDAYAIIKSAVDERRIRIAPK